MGLVHERSTMACETRPSLRAIQPWRLFPIHVSVEFVQYTTCFCFEQLDKDGLKKDLDAAGVATDGMREEALQKERRLAQVLVCLSVCVSRHLLPAFVCRSNVRISRALSRDGRGWEMKKKLKICPTVCFWPSGLPLSQAKRESTYLVFRRERSVRKVQTLIGQHVLVAGALGCT